jgi:hypothetical protein
MPEGSSPDEDPETEQEDDDPICPPVSDLFRTRTESLDE